MKHHDWEDAARKAGEESNPNDVHVMPIDPKRPHASLRSCWCLPTINFIADNGNTVWLHRELH